jgi:undecaprenyl-diphosphatase
VNTFDVTLIALLNELAQRSLAFDSFVVFISGNGLLKGGILTMLIWWAWFSPGDTQERIRNREAVLATLFACFVAVFIAALLQGALPFRLRPLNRPELGFKLPYTMNAHAFAQWGSSFPSGHATLFFSMAAGLYSISRFVGTVSLLYVLVIICIPRIYTGLHFPTDIIGGAVLGIGTAYLVISNTALKRRMHSTALPWEQRSPATFYPCFFILTYLIITGFDDVRRMATFMITITSALLKLG